MKNTLLLKTTNRRNIPHTKEKEKEKYKVQRKKQRKERKMPATPKKKLAVRPAKHNKKTYDARNISSHNISCCDYI